MPHLAVPRNSGPSGPTPHIAAMAPGFDISLFFQSTLQAFVKARRNSSGSTNGARPPNRMRRPGRRRHPATGIVGDDAGASSPGAMPVLVRTQDEALEAAGRAAPVPGRQCFDSALASSERHAAGIRGLAKDRPPHGDVPPLHGEPPNLLQDVRRHLRVGESFEFPC